MKKRFFIFLAVMLVLSAGTVQARASIISPASEFKTLGEGSGLGLEEVPEKTEADAAYNLGIKYYNGGAGNIKTAVEWFRKAAELGSAQGQFRLGAAYETGESVKKNYAEALKWYRLSARQKNKGGEYGLGRLYSRGHGVKRDYAAAVKWHKLSAEQGVSFAQYELGMLYLKGNGVMKDSAEAYFWLALAATDLDDAMEKRDEAAAQLTPEKLEATRKRLKEWKPVDASELPGPAPE